MAASALKIEVRYFAILKSLAGKDQETIEIPNDWDAKALYSYLKSQYDFPLAMTALRLAINDCFSPFATPLQSGDRVVFIPPVQGG